MYPEVVYSHGLRPGVSSPEDSGSESSSDADLSHEPDQRTTGPKDLKDCIYLPQAPTDNSEGRDPPPKHVLIYFLPGNPGLIEYYRSFLTHLSTTLDPDATNTVYHVIGMSLCQFELHPHAVFQPLRLPLSPHLGDDPVPYALRDQVSHVRINLEETIARIQDPEFQKNDDLVAGEVGEPLPVILVGHSVGVYILMETIAWRQRPQKTGYVSLIARDREWEIIGGICLFPTIVDLAGSPRGRWLAPIAKLPFFTHFIQMVVRLLCRMLPEWLLTIIVKRVAKQDASAAKVTSAFLRSRYGVRQALHMARHEFLEMTHDKWPDEVWDRSASIVPPPDSTIPDDTKVDRPRLYFYWGANDHWIANKTRDNIISTRAGKADVASDAGKPYMEIDTRGTPHDFCIRPDHSKQVAEKVAEYVEKIMESRT